MNPETGHLIDLDGAIERIRGLDPEAYVKLPESLHRAAAKKLRGKAEAHVSLTSGGKLSVWARQERAKRKIKNKIAKESRRRNRH